VVPTISMGVAGSDGLQFEMLVPPSTRAIQRPLARSDSATALDSTGLVVTDSADPEVSPEVAAAFV